MALNKITYTDKVALSPQPSVAAVNKVTDSDMNEIKSVVNDAIDQVDANTNNITNLSNYSSSEVATGEKWYDGKPIYRQVIYIPSLPNNTGTQYQHGIANVDKIWVNQGKSFIYWPSLGNSSPFPYISMGDASSPVGYNAMIELRSIGKTTFEIKTAYDRSSLSAYITFEYTKTTD